MPDRLRLNVCSHSGICIPVRFQIDLQGVRADFMTEDVQELVDAIYRADDALEEAEEEDAE